MGTGWKTLGYIIYGRMQLMHLLLELPLLVKQSVMDISLPMKTMKRFLIGIRSNIPGSSPTKHGLSLAKPTRTKIVLLLPTLQAMVIILCCRILGLQKGVGMGCMLKITFHTPLLTELFIQKPIHRFTLQSL